LYIPFKKKDSAGSTSDEGFPKMCGCWKCEVIFMWGFYGKQYGPPGMDGERMHMAVHDEKQGISISMNLCIPFTDLWNSSTHQDPSVVITDLHFSLSSVFLCTWFGRSTV
jgi:hypothetical protein